MRETILAAAPGSTGELYRTIFENTGSATFIVENSMIISLVNSEFVRLTGYTRREVEGRRKIIDIVPPSERERIAEYHRIGGDDPADAPRHYETKVLTRSGAVRDVLASADLIPGTKRRVISCIDITGQKETQRNLVNSVSRLTVLSRTTQRLNAELEMEAVLRELVSAAMELSGATGGTAGLVVNGTMVFREYRRDGTVMPVSFSFPPGVGVPGWVLRNRKAYSTNNAAQDPYLLPDVRLQFGIRTLVDIPILGRRGELLGCFEIYNKKNNEPFDELDLLMLQGLAASASVALENAQFFRELRRTQEELRRSYDRQKKTTGAIVETLLKVVEVRDPYTAGHEHHTADLAAAIGREMGLEETRIEAIRMGAIVHDIGKMYVPAEILSKPGPLTALEFNIIRIHPLAGYDILKIIDFPGPVAEIVLEHHERYNGSGYPRGLRDGQILLEARVLMVADVIDSISLHRPYRPATGLATALGEIEHNRGILFDPGVVDATLRLFNEKKYTY